jgi:hypothetical protein
MLIRGNCATYRSSWQVKKKAPDTVKPRLKREFHRLFRSMDFVSRHPALKRDTAEARRLADVYQQLGVAWEFLALQCNHDAGWRKARDGKRVCKTCGTVKTGRERWLLLPRDGKKSIGRRAMPNSKRTFKTRKMATVVNDTVNFHGAKLNVEVLNLHRSRLFPRSGILCAAERIVSLQEGGIEYRIDGHLASIELRKHKRGEMPPYGAFVWELPRKLLKNFPIMLEYDKRRHLVGLTIFRPSSVKRRTSKSQAVDKSRL